MRMVSLTFDDGLSQGAAAAVEILNRHRLAASFYIVTGWVEPVRAPIRDHPNQGRSHGDWAFWRKVTAAGHEVGSHTFSHFKAGGIKAALTPWKVASEIRKAREDLAREVPQGAYTMSMPWNAATPLSDALVRRQYMACRVGGDGIPYNRPGDFNRYALASWAPAPRHGWDEHLAALDAIPEDGWLILGYHSLDGEGWEPVTSEFFERLCAHLAASQIEVVTVREGVERWAGAGFRKAG